MAALVFDAGALIALERGDRGVAAMLVAAAKSGTEAITSSACVAQASCAILPVKPGSHAPWWVSLSAIWTHEPHAIAGCSSRAAKRLISLTQQCLFWLETAIRCLRVITKTSSACSTRRGRGRASGRSRAGLRRL